MVTFSRHLLYPQSMRNILKDYANTFRSFASYFRAHPVKCSLLNSTLLLYLVLCHHCPDNDSYSNYIISSTNEISLISHKLRNMETDRKLLYLMQMNDDARICTFSFGPCRFAYVLGTSPNTRLYSFSSHLFSPSNILLYDKLLDVGLMNNWLYMKRIMVDFDVNGIE